MQGRYVRRVWNGERAPSETPPSGDELFVLLGVLQAEACTILVWVQRARKKRFIICDYDKLAVPNFY